FATIPVMTGIVDRRVRLQQILLVPEGLVAGRHDRPSEPSGGQVGLDRHFRERTPAPSGRRPRLAESGQPMIFLGSGTAYVERLLVLRPRPTTASASPTAAPTPSITCTRTSFGISS